MWLEILVAFLIFAYTALVAGLIYLIQQGQLVVSCKATPVRKEPCKSKPRLWLTPAGTPEGTPPGSPSLLRRQMSTPSAPSAPPQMPGNFSTMSERGRLAIAAFRPSQKFSAAPHQDPHHFLQVIEDDFRRYGIPDEERLSLIASCLEGEARKWLTHKTRSQPFHSWDLFQQSFLDFYSPFNKTELAKRLFSKRFSEQENIEEYVFDYENLYLRWKETASENEIAQGLLSTLPPRLKALFLDRDYYELDEIIRRVRCCSYSRKESSKNPRTENNVRPNRSKQTPSRPTGRYCYICNAPDHLANTCPQRGKTKEQKEVKTATTLGILETKSSGSDSHFLRPVIGLGKKYITAMIDTGASHSVINQTLVKDFAKLGFKVKTGAPVSLQVINGQKQVSVGSMQLPCEIKGVQLVHTFLVVKDLVENVIIGRDLLDAFQIEISYKDRNFVVHKPVSKGKQETPDLNVIKTEVDLDPEWKQRFQKLLNKCKNLFHEKPGLTNVVEHTIDTGDNPPIFKAPYKTSLEKQQIMQKQVEEMLQDGIIERASSPWSSPVVLVPKKDKTLRFCVDFRQLNAKTKTSHFPLPTIPALLRNLGTAKIFSTLDLASGYWQVPIAPQDREKCAFIVGQDMYQFRVMPFGLKNAPATFQKLMNTVLNPFIGKFCEVYLDDIIIYSRNLEEHLLHLEKVFECLQSAGLTLNATKCHFLCKNLNYLGFGINEHGLITQDDKIQAIRNFTPPKNVRQLKRFLGMCSWYMSFVKDFATIARPLYQLTRKGLRWKWSEDAEKAFTTLKNNLTEAPVLTLPKPNTPFVLYTDASDYGLGAVLHQPQVDGKLKPLAFASRVLQPPERNYSVTERECLAVVWACEKFAPFFTGEEITVVTDHAALSWLQNAKQLKGKLSRWAIKLQEYPLKIIHRKGSDLVVPDALSRNPVCSSPVEEKDIDHKLYLFEVCNSDEIQREQRKDIELKQIIEYLETESLPADPQVSASIINRSRCYVLQDGLLKFQKKPNTSKIAIPAALQKKVLHEFHDIPSAGHLGIKKTFQQMQNRVYWPHMRKDVQNYVKSCMICQQMKPNNAKVPGAMQPTSVNAPCEMLGVDLIGPLPATNRGFTQILVVCDYYSKWVEVFPLRKGTAKAIAMKLLYEVFFRYGFPKSILSDNGPQFVSSVMSELCTLLKVKRKLTTPYHPQTNLTERFNRTIGTMIRCYIEKNHTTWDKLLPHFAFAIRTTVSETTGFTPAKLFLGRDINLPWDQHMQLDVFQKAEHLKDIEEQVFTNVKKAQSKQKFYYDKNRKKEEFQVGELVLLKTHFLSSTEEKKTRKFMPKWSGPFIIAEKLSPLVYKLTDELNNNIGTHNIANLKKYYPRNLTANHKLNDLTVNNSSSTQQIQDEIDHHLITSNSTLSNFSEKDIATLTVPPPPKFYSEVSPSDNGMLLPSPLQNVKPDESELNQPSTSQFGVGKRLPRVNYQALAGIKQKKKK